MRYPAKLFCTLVLAIVVNTSLAQDAQTFTNPLLPSGADPWSIYKDGFYYYTNTTGSNITIWKTTNLANLQSAERKTIFRPPAGTMWSRNLWAPEIHFLRGKWYVYFAADDGKNENHRLYVIENASPDPMQGEWRLIGKVADPSDKWAIDGSVFEYNKELYMTWSGWEGDVNKRQDIYIAKMQNPWTISGNRVRISSPVYDWERFGDLNDANNPPHVDVNEGPQVLQKGKHTFLIYSASGCWTEHYSLGMLTLTGKNLMDSTSWKKSAQPVFTRSEENKVFAPGHNSFFKSPDGKEDWILYHANSQPGQGCGRHRTPRAQKFGWKKDGTPDFGVPVQTGVSLPLPSGRTSGQ
jgi:GH43 family beta-xylosidase